MKKQYVTPGVEVLAIQSEALICASLSETNATNLGISFGGDYAGTTTADADERYSDNDEDDLW